MRVRHAAFVYFAQQHFGKAFVHLPQRFVKRGRHCRHLRHGKDGLAQFGHAQPAQALRRIIRMRINVFIVYISSDVRKELITNLVRIFIENDNINRHVVFKQKFAYSVHRYP